MILTPENYYSKEANLHYMSVSQYKEFIQCEARALATLSGEYEDGPKDFFTLGSYVHAAIEGDAALTDFCEKHPEIYASTGKNKGELKAEYKQADRMIHTVLSDPLCAQMLEGEKEVIATAELFGVRWKARIDVRSREEGRMADLKTVKEIRARYWNDTLRKWESFVEHFGYVTQMAVYREIERIYSRSFEPLEPFIVAVSKEEAPDKEVICFDELALSTELENVRARLPRVVAVKGGVETPVRCEKCRYCRQTKKAKIVHFESLLEVV